MGDAELRAFDALGKSAKLADLVAIARPLLGDAARTRRSAWLDPSRVRKLAKKAGLKSSDISTPFGDPLAVLERGPRDDAERALACALWAHVLADSPPKGHEAEARAAAELLWLAVHTPFDATELVDRALGDAAADLWASVAECVKRIDRGEAEGLGRGEALVGAAALALSSQGARLATALASEVHDRKVARVLAAGDGGGVDAGQERLVGELAPPPRSPLATAALALTGLLFLLHAARLLGKWALAYRRPAEVQLASDGVRIRSRTELLGRTLKDREYLVPRTGLVRATREVRYPRAAFYAGLLALAVGSYFGVSMLVDGVRAASPSLLLTGLTIVAVGIGLDFLLASVAPSARGECRLLFVPRKGPKVCVGGVEAARADAILLGLAKRGSSPTHG